MSNSKKVVSEEEEAEFAFASPAITALRLPKHFGRDQGIHPGSLPRRTHVTNLDIDVTEDCNLGCLYCFKGEMVARHMSLDTMKRALDWLIAASGSASTVNCNFMGGEPTMRFKVIKQFVPWARSRGQAQGKLVTFSMTTNLTLFTDEIRSFVDEYGFGILMSIDGSPDVQDGQRPSKNGKLVSSVVEKWAKSMLQSRPGSTARATLTASNAGTVAESFRYLANIGFQEVAISACEYGDWVDHNFEDLEKQLLEIEADTVAIWANGGKFLPSAYRYYINALIRHRHAGEEDAIEWSKQPCGAGKGYMMIDYTGDIWPCHRFDGADADSGAGGDFKFGNVFTGGFDDDLQRAFLDFDHTKMHKSSCETCPVNPICGGYCPAANLSDTGSIYTPHDTFCRWTQIWYASANRFYTRIKALGESTHERFLLRADGASGTGEK